MKVYSFFEPGVREWEDQTEVIEMWKASWSSWGWEPIVLSIEDAKKHPKYRAMLGAIRGYPTVNPRTFEAFCFLRWLAMPVVGGGWLFDWDVLNYGFRPLDPGSAASAGLNRIGGAGFWGRVSDYEWIVDQMLTYRPDPYLDTYREQPHVSDMTILRRVATTKYRCLGLEAEFGDPDWEKAPLVHYGGARTRRSPGIPRAEEMRIARRGWRNKE
jgi:hypothetical protein